MLDPKTPALILAPMEGITDAPMRALQGAVGAFTFAVSEFLRVSGAPLPPKVFLRDVPELATGGKTVTGLPVQLQILGGDPDRMALSAVAACKAGAEAIDLNFGCPAKTVNRNDGGASLLQHPTRIRDIVAAVRQAVPREVPVSAKLRLGWDRTDTIDENAQMAAEGGASWLTVHARTRVQGYAPPVDWPAIGRVRAALDLPVVANGDIWSLDDFRRCRDETGCCHFMIGRGVLANPPLPFQIAGELGIRTRPTCSEMDLPPPFGVGDGRSPRPAEGTSSDVDWPQILRALAYYVEVCRMPPTYPLAMRMKQWLKLAHLHGSFAGFDSIKRAATVEELLACV